MCKAGEDLLGDRQVNRADQELPVASPFNLTVARGSTARLPCDISNVEDDGVRLELSIHIFLPSVINLSSGGHSNKGYTEKNAV